MNKNTQYTKKRLTLIFSIIVFLIVFFISTIFSTVKFYSISHIARNEFSFIAENIDNGTIKFEDIKNKKIIRDEDKTFRNSPGLLSYAIVDSDKNIISNIFNSDIDITFFEKLYNIDEAEIFYKNNFYIKIINIEDNSKLYLIYEKNYNAEDFLLDLLVFLFISFVSGIFVFFFLKIFINKLFIPVEKSIVNMNDFVHNAWHELQTPLSTIVSNIDFYNKIKIKDPSVLQEIKDESLRMWDLIKSLLKLSEENYSTDLEEVEVNNFLEKIIKTHNYSLENKSIKLILNINYDQKININKNHLRICLSNIISNSIKYSNENSTIKISFDNFIFSIEDNWIWIWKENLSKIFDRFYKEDESRTTNWFGIWLSLVKKLCTLNNRIINVKSEKSKGTIFTININK